MGSVIEQDSDKVYAMPKDSVVHVNGGKYAVLESRAECDKDNLKDRYQILYRLAFAGWLWENWVRIDFDRLSFVEYEKGKLYFYVPVMGEESE